MAAPPRRVLGRSTDGSHLTSKGKDRFRTRGEAGVPAEARHPLETDEQRARFPSVGSLSQWLIVVGLVGRGLKDLWQHRRQFVANTRWWPPFCVVVDWVAAAIIAVAIIAGVDLQ